jgi:hypothetical protein
MYEEDEDPPCECIQTDVDEFSARYCPAHGPGSTAEREWKKREAEDEAAAAARISYLLGIDPKDWEYPDDRTPF